jgi:hypothetical protein
MTAAEIPDVLVLAAIERAIHHGPSDDLQMASVNAILRHLDMPTRSGAARRVRAQRHALELDGLLERSRWHSQEMWALTSRGRRQLERARAAGAMPPLPEAPQHRAWREARTLAEDSIEQFRLELATTLKDGLALLEEADAPTRSDVWAALSKRLERDYARLTGATYCLHEWAEPSDDRSGHAEAHWHHNRLLRS